MQVWRSNLKPLTNNCLSRDEQLKLSSKNELASKLILEQSIYFLDKGKYDKQRLLSLLYAGRSYTRFRKSLQYVVVKRNLLQA